MPAGPIVIFDKSLLQSLNQDEAMWLDHFFLTNITPLFFIETLADLEKQVRAGRTPEEVVGNLAYKTPDMQSRPNVHHMTLVAAELLGTFTVEMSLGRPIISGGKAVMLEGKSGVIYQQTPEEEAFDRWNRGEFLDVERLRAKAWRQALSNFNCDAICERLKSWLSATKPKTFLDVKRVVDAVVDGVEQETVLRLGLSLFGFLHEAEAQVIGRWQEMGKPAIKTFVPYFTHVLSVDLTFYLAIAANLISPSRKSNRADFAYVYYLPFCMVFTSSDKLHAEIVPLFLRNNQSFVKGADFKADLARLDQHYSALPEEVKNKGAFNFAKYPPTESRFLVTDLWDTHLPIWRRHESESHALTSGEEKKVVEHINRLKEDSIPADTRSVVNDEMDYMLIQRKVFAAKGKWKRFSTEQEKAMEDESNK